MASPQKENGFTGIANELVEVFYQCKLREYERVLVLCIWRKTYGWGKKEDWISNSQFSDETGIARPHITRTLRALKSKSIVTSSGNKICINKNWEEWKVEWRKLPHQVTKVTSLGNEKLPHQVPTKEKKETIQKKLASNDAKTMKKNSFRYNEKNHDDAFEDVVDIETGETVPNKLEEINQKVTSLIQWAEGVRGKKFFDTPTQRKMIHDMRKLNIDPGRIKTTFIDLIQSEYWQKQDRLPDFKTVFSALKNKK